MAKMEKVVAYVKAPYKVSDFAPENLYGGVQMILCKPPWHIKTED